MCAEPVYHIGSDLISAAQKWRALVQFVPFRRQGRVEHSNMGTVPLQWRHLSDDVAHRYVRRLACACYPRVYEKCSPAKNMLPPGWRAASKREANWPGRNMASLAAVLVDQIASAVLMRRSYTPSRRYTSTPGKTAPGFCALLTSAAATSSCLSSMRRQPRPQGRPPSHHSTGNHPADREVHDGLATLSRSGSDPFPEPRLET